MLRVVLDVNVVVSGWLQARGPSARILAKIIAGRLQVIISAAIVAEHRRSLRYSKVRRRLAVPADMVEAWIDALVFLADVVAADPEDDKYLAAALEGRASFIVSGDRDLLDVGTHEGIRILTPRAFLEVLEAEAGS